MPTQTTSLPQIPPKLPGTLVKTIHRSSKIITTPRLQQMIGMFDVPPATHSSLQWNVNLQLPEIWNIGVIVGPSGSGKSTIARELFGKAIGQPWRWPKDRCIIDGFPREMGIREIVGLLSSVGFSSPPSWVRPFRVLSTGEQFRVNVARALAENPRLAVVDEFTSVVDRTVAQVGSAAIAKAVRRRNQKFIAITSHYDVLDWLQPDWIYEPHTNRMEAANAARGSLRPRPPIELQIVRTDRSAWNLFKPHHYLSGDLHRSAACFVGLVQNQPAAFTAMISFPHPVSPAWREHRTVCLPDFQGIGIGNAMSEYVMSLYAATGKRVTSVTSHPSMIRHRTRSPLWSLRKALGFNRRHTGLTKWKSKNTSLIRLTASFEYIGPAKPEESRGFGVLKDIESHRRSRTAAACLEPQTV